MLIKTLFILPLFLYVSAFIPKFERAIPYTPITTAEEPSLPTEYNASKPLGFSTAILPYHGNINDQVYNPVIEITGLQDTYIELKAETQVNGARICFADNAANSVVGCGSGKVEACYTPSSTTLKFEFYCDGSCDSDNVNFFYRIVKSEADADDLWCTNRGDSGWPSDLIPGPSVLPSKKTTPVRQGHGNSANAMLPSLFTFLISTILFYVMM